MARKSAARNQAKREQDEFDAAYRKMTGSRKYAKKSKKKNNTAAIIAVCIAVVAVVFSVAVGYLYLMM